MVMRPDVGGMKPVSMRMVVDLPAPFGPRKPSTSPRSTVNDTSFTASFGPKLFTRFSTLIIPPPRTPAFAAAVFFVRLRQAPRTRSRGLAVFAPVLTGNPAKVPCNTLEWGPGPLWCRQSDSNRRPTAYKAVALPLSYVGSGRNYSAVPPRRQRSRGEP